MKRDPLEAVVRAVRRAEGLNAERALELLLPLDTLRDLARRHGLSIKGFRVDRAPAGKIAAALAAAEPDVVDEALAAAFAAFRGAGDAESAPEEASEPDEALRRLLEYRDSELEQAREGLRRRAEQESRIREREQQLQRRVDEAERELVVLRGSLEDCRGQLRLVDAAEPRRDDRDARIHELERDVEAFGEAEQGLRRLLSARQAQVRSLESRVAELEELVPKGRRRKERPPAAPPLDERFRIPHFVPSFARSLEGKERRSIERAYQAVLLFCVEGPTYPGLEVKQIEGQDLWSLRASLKLRVYFRVRDDGDVDLLALADREDQHTTLRRLKERS